MANRRTHLIVGTAAGAAAAAYTARQQQPGQFMSEVLGGSLGGAIGGLVPDLIEPAIHSWHRSIAHSYTTAVAIAAVARQRVADWQQHCRTVAAWHDYYQATATSDWSRLWHGFMAFIWRLLSGFAAGLPSGYLSHLALDARTPRGIPLLA